MGFSWSDLDPTYSEGAFGELINRIDDKAESAWDDLTGKSSADKQSDTIAAAAERDNAFAHPDVVGPFGSSTVSVDPETGRVTLTQSLSPEQQALVDALRGDLGTGRESVEDAMFARASSRLDPQWQDRENQARTRLYNMGLREGDAAYDRALRDLSFERTDAYDRAMNTATIAGGQEQSRLINALLAAGNPGLNPYYGGNNSTNAAVAGANLMGSVPSTLETIMSLYSTFGSDS